MTDLHWSSAAVSPDLAEALGVLAEEYPLREDGRGVRLVFEWDAAAKGMTCIHSADAMTIRYRVLAEALRGVGAALSHQPEVGGSLQETCPFRTLGIMLDCSRNAVMTVEHLQGWLRRLALLGYTVVMLYTEDTYEVEDQPLFGAFRGRYSREELQAIDRYAASLGIETIGCIQTLGHLEQVLQWGAFRGVKDTNGVLLADEEASYRLIAGMLDTYAESLHSRRIHLGMDEAVGIGRGQHLDQHGWERPFDIFNRHLERVMALCRERGLEPMIWSDMYFRLGSASHDYYDAAVAIPEDVRAAIPAGVSLVYWDYYHEQEAHYRAMIGRHQTLGRTTIMGSGVWTWRSLWYQHGKTERRVPPCVEACRAMGIDELFFTLWGDDGAYCEFDSAWAGLVFAAGHCYGDTDATSHAARYQGVCGGALDAVLLGARLTDSCLSGTVTTDFDAPSLLWDDPLQGMYWLGKQAQEAGFWEAAAAFHRQLVEDLAPHVGQTEPVDLAHAGTLAGFLESKIAFRTHLEDAYFGGDAAAMGELATEAEVMANRVDEVAASFRRQWLRRNKPFGLETIQRRLGGQRARFLECAAVLQACSGDPSLRIAELDAGRAMPEATRQGLPRGRYRHHDLATATRIQ